MIARCPECGRALSGELCFACGYDASAKPTAASASPLAPPKVEKIDARNEPQQNRAPEMHDPIFDAGLDLEKSGDPFQPKTTKPQWTISNDEAPDEGGFTDDFDPFISNGGEDPFAIALEEEAPLDLGEHADEVDVDLNDADIVSEEEVVVEHKEKSLPPQLPIDDEEDDAFDPFFDSTEPFAKVPDDVPELQFPEATGGKEEPDIDIGPIELIAELAGLAIALETEGRNDDASIVKRAIKSLS